MNELITSKLGPNTPMDKKIRLNLTLTHKWPWTSRSYIVFCLIFAITFLFINRLMVCRLEQDLLGDQSKFDQHQIIEFIKNFHNFVINRQIWFILGPKNTYDKVWPWSSYDLTIKVKLLNFTKIAITWHVNDLHLI